MPPHIDTQLSASGYADRRKELLKLVNDLRGIGFVTQSHPPHVPLNAPTAPKLISTFHE